MSQEYTVPYESSGGRIPLALTRTFSLGAGQHTLHLLVYNSSGSPIIRNAMLTALVIED